jgi:hypothetical protein
LRFAAFRENCRKVVHALLDFFFYTNKTSLG